jgi:hypothetical protein
MLDAADVLEVLYEVVDKLALALGGPQLFQSAYQVGWHHFMHTVCQGMVLASYSLETRIHACAYKQHRCRHACIWPTFCGLLM